MSNTIAVNTSTTDAYTITIGKGLLNHIRDFVLTNHGSNKIFLIIDQNVHDQHIAIIEGAFQNSFLKILKYVVPPGERSKSMNQYIRIMDFILKEGVERNTPVLAIGGGVVGDLSGFVAASVMRGLPVIHIPTTLLAMVDSSIGGKTGINHNTGKNLIGSFYQPKAVYMDVDFLETLPANEWINGLSEIIKYGLIKQPELLETLSSLINRGDIASPEQWIEVIKKSAQIKIDIVQRDVKEGGVRAFLNFGHTFAHVIERMGNYQDFSHGEAVFAGMYGAVHASIALGANLTTDYLDTYKPLYNFSLNTIEQDAKVLTQWMLNDKKVQDAAIRLVLLKAVGNPFIHKVEDLGFVEASWQYTLKTFS